MKGVHREDDLTMGHDCWPPTTPQTWSENVRIGGKGIVRKGDTITPHICQYGGEAGQSHGGTYIDDSAIRVNGRAAQKCGSPIQCDNGDMDYADTCASGGKVGF